MYFFNRKCVYKEVSVLINYILKSKNNEDVTILVDDYVIMVKANDEDGVLVNEYIYNL